MGARAPARCHIARQAPHAHRQRCGRSGCGPALADHTHWTFSNRGRYARLAQRARLLQLGHAVRRPWCVASAALCEAAVVAGLASCQCKSVSVRCASWQFAWAWGGGLTVSHPLPACCAHVARTAARRAQQRAPGLQLRSTPTANGYRVLAAHVKYRQACLRSGPGYSTENTVCDEQRRSAASEDRCDVRVPGRRRRRGAPPMRPRARGAAAHAPGGRAAQTTAASCSPSRPSHTYPAAAPTRTLKALHRRFVDRGVCPTAAPMHAELCPG